MESAVREPVDSTEWRESVSGDDCEREREGGAADGSLLLLLESRLLLVSMLPDRGESGLESYHDSICLECDRWLGSRRP